MSRNALSLLLLLNLALAGVLAWLWITPDGRLRDVRWQPPQPVPPTLGSPEPLPDFDVDVNRFVATLERPLFVPSRRPPPTPQNLAATPPAPPPDPMPDIRVLGLYGNADSGGMIANVDGKVRRVRVGDAVAGQWTLKSLRGNEIVVARGDEERIVELLRSVGTAPEVAAAASSPSAAASSTASQAATATASEAPDPSAASAAPANVARERELERRRDQVRRVNAARARRGLPLLPEP